MGTGRKGAGLRPLKARISKGLNTGSFINVTDNSGGKIAKIINVRGYHGVKGRQPKCGVGDTIYVVIKSGDASVVHKVFPAVVVRQKMLYRRANGSRIGFEDNACVLVKDTEKYEPVGTIMKGPLPREISLRFANITKIASKIV